MKARLAITLTLLLIAMPLGAAIPDAASGDELRPLPDADTSAMEGAAKDKIEAARQKIEELHEGGSAGPEELADAWGYLGQLYHAFRLLDAAETCYANARTLVPNDFRWHYYLGLVHHARGELEPATASYDRVLELRAGDLAALIHSGNALLELDREADAAARFERALELDAESAAARFGIGKARAFAGEYEQAVALFEEALELQPAAGEIHYPLAQAYRRLGDLDQAREHLKERSEAPVRFPDPLGDQILRLEKSTALEVVLSLARAAESEGFSEEDFLGFAISQVGEVRGAIEQLRQGLAIADEETASAGERARIHYVLGGLMVNEGRDDEAIFQFRKALELDPELVDARVKLGNALARDGQVEAALESYDRVLAKAPENPAALLKRAAARMALERHAEAAADLEKLVGVEPSNSEARVRLGLTQARLGDLAAAAASLGAALELDLASEERARVALQLARVERERGELARAEENYRRVLEADPDQVEALGGLGSLYAEQGRMTDSAEAYARWVEIQPSNAGPRLAEATALILGGQYAAARDRLEAALEAVPGDLRILDVLARHLAACPDPEVRDGERALELARRLYEKVPSAESMETLAMAFAQAGRFDDAVSWQKRLITEHGSRAEAAYRQRLEGNLARYEAGQTCCVE